MALAVCVTLLEYEGVEEYVGDTLALVVGEGVNVPEVETEDDEVMVWLTVGDREGVTLPLTLALDEPEDVTVEVCVRVGAPLVLGVTETVPVLLTVSV